MLLSACAATPYQAENKLQLTRGYGEKNVNVSLTKVHFTANGSTPDEQIKEYVLLRAAEIGKQRNKSYFAVYKDLADAADDRKSDPCISKELRYVPVGYAYILYSNSRLSGYLSVAEVLKRYNKYMER